MNRFAQNNGGEEQKYAVNELLGKPAPDFTLTVLDGAGKTRTISKADLAGKVVLIDFWATWCPPCRKELPELQKLIEACTDTKKDVIIVALSQDKEPQELAEVRKLVETTLEKDKIVLTGNPVGKIALDPSGTTGDAFKVEAIPDRRPPRRPGRRPGDAHRPAEQRLQAGRPGAEQVDRNAPGGQVAADAQGRGGRQGQGVRKGERTTKARSERSEAVRVRSFSPRREQQQSPRACALGD